MDALDEIAVLAHGVQDLLAHPGHDGHIEHHVNGVGQLNAVLGKGRTHHRHGVRDHVHGPPFHGAVTDAALAEEHLPHLVRGHPVIGGTGVLLLLAADQGPVLHPGHVVGVRPMQVAAGELFLIEFDEDPLFHGLPAQLLKLLLTAVDPYDPVGPGHLHHAVDPVQHGLVFCKRHFSVPLLSNCCTGRRPAAQHLFQFQMGSACENTVPIFIVHDF